MPETRNSKALASFVSFCKDHPDQRFWQALRNWSKFNFILGANGLDGWDATDTFCLEGLEGTRDAQN